MWRCENLNMAKFYISSQLVFSLTFNVTTLVALLTFSIAIHNYCCKH
jgi:hypothetical protein